MSSAFGHALETITAGSHWFPKRVPHWNRVAFPDTLIWSPSCSTSGCDQRPEFVSSYRYVTGRAGRVSSQRRFMCTAHAQAFAQKHGLELPPSVAP